MNAEQVNVKGWLRWLSLAGITALGLITIVGSGGGGALGFPPCEGLSCGGSSPPPLVAEVEPAYVTAVLGSPVRYTLAYTSVVGPLTYQWRRSSDGGLSYVDIAGATGRELSITSVQPGDDGTRYQIDVRSAAGASLVQAVGHLAVATRPGIVFEDTEFAPADWIVSPMADTGQVAFMHSEQQLLTGGHPGAHRKMVFQLPPGTGSARVFYLSRSAGYEPAVQGAIQVIDYAEDCAALPATTTTFTQSGMVIEQGGRRYVSDGPDTCVASTWAPVAGRASLGVQDFRRFHGPACNAGESCPDFSASALPMRFGYWRISFGTPGSTIGHGIDNWQVTVFRR